jgi:hypothetical protein
MAFFSHHALGGASNLPNLPNLSHLSSFARRTNGESVLGNVLQLGLIGLVAGGTSYMNAKHAAPGRQAYEVLGVPADLALGLSFTGLALAGYFGEHAKSGQNIGHGFLAAYVVRLCRTWGEEARMATPAAASNVRGSFTAPRRPLHSVGTEEAAPFPWAA